MPRRKADTSASTTVTETDHRLNGGTAAVRVDVVLRSPEVHPRSQGPWSVEADKIAWFDPATGYGCIIRRAANGGHLCGYVGVGPGHPVFGYLAAALRGIGIKAHGAIDYAAPCERPETWTLLTTACPDRHCGAVQRWRWTRGIDICDRCGGPLDRADTPEVPLSLRASLANAVGIIHPDSATRTKALARLPDDLAAMTPAGVLDLLGAVAGVVDPAIRYPAARQLIHPNSEPGRIIEAVATAFPVLEGWPDAFVGLASERLSRRVGKHGDGNRGATIAFLDLPSRCTLQPEVANVISDMRRLLGAGREAGYSPEQAAAKCGTRPSTILAARREGRIPTVFHLDGNRAVALLGRRHVDELGRTFRIPYHAAAASLGVTYRSIEELVALGILDQCPLELKARSVPAVTGRSLNALNDRLMETGGGPIEDGVSLELAMRAVGGRLKPWAGTLCAMLDAAIPFRLDGRGRGLIRRALVGRSAWIALRDVADVPEPFPGAFSGAMSKADAADALNLRPSGYALLSRWPSSHGWTRTVPVCEVIAMTQSLISPAEIAARLNVASKQVRKLMRHAEVRRISHAGYDRQAFDQNIKLLS
jgi:hypothetical protein